MEQFFQATVEYLSSLLRDLASADFILMIVAALAGALTSVVTNAVSKRSQGGLRIRTERGVELGAVSREDLKDESKIKALVDALEARAKRLA